MVCQVPSDLDLDLYTYVQLADTAFLTRCFRPLDNLFLRSRGSSLTGLEDVLGQIETGKG
jgi:hypothetical protein